MTMPVHRIVLPTPWAVGPVNVYLIEGDPLTLIDAGPLTPEAEESLARGLAARGAAISDLKRVVITHGHPDHYGLAERIRELSGAELNVHRLEIPKTHLDGPYWEAIGALMRAAGMPATVMTDFETHMEAEARYRRPLNHVVPLRDGERIPAGGRLLEVMAFPGHAAGHICLLEPETRALFSGDHLLKDITPNPLFEPDRGWESDWAPGSGRVPARAKALKQYLSSLDTLYELEFSVVYPAHGEHIDDHRAQIQETRAHHAWRLERIYDTLAADGTAPVTPYQLSRLIFPRVRGFEVLLAVTEVVGHLDLLEEAGRVRSQVGGDSVIRYAPVR